MRETVYAANGVAAIRRKALPRQVEQQEEATAGRDWPPCRRVKCAACGGPFYTTTWVVTERDGKRERLHISCFLKRQHAA